MSESLRPNCPNLLRENAPLDSSRSTRRSERPGILGGSGPLKARKTAYRQTPTSKLDFPDNSRTFSPYETENRGEKLSGSHGVVRGELGHKRPEIGRFETVPAILLGEGAAGVLVSSVKPEIKIVKHVSLSLNHRFCATYELCNAVAIFRGRGSEIQKSNFAVPARGSMVPNWPYRTLKSRAT